MKKVFLLVFLFYVFCAAAQLNESFSDGDFTNGISWNGSTVAWQVIANSDVASGAPASQTLRLNTASGSGTQYLSTQIVGSWGTQQTWAFWLGRRSQAATASNMIFVWLYANEPDVSGNTVDGYRIRFGDDLASGDKLILESVNNGVGTSILSSAAVTNGITDYGILVRLSRDGSGQWNLFTSTLPAASGTGAVASAIPNAANTNVLHGSVIHTAVNVFDNGYVAFAAVHSSTAAARTAAEFDQFIFSFAGSGSLPVRFGNIQAVSSASGVRLEWDNQTETDIRHYNVERSVNGMEFISLIKLDPSRNDGGRAAYLFTDRQPANGHIYYRIRAEETGGQVRYSRVIRVSGDGVRQSLMIYPNPVEDKRIQIEVSNFPPGNYNILVFGSAGELVYKIPFQHPGSWLSRTVICNQLVSGWYTLEIRGPAVVKKKFVVQ